MHAALKIFAPPVFIGFVAGACSSSTPAPAQSEAQKEDTADATYLGDMLLCRDKVKYPVLEQSEACLAAKRKKWHRLPDGGPDGTYQDGGL